jgi:hypothetical protein
MASFVDRHQVIVMSKHYIALRCLLHSSVISIERIVSTKYKTTGL